MAPFRILPGGTTRQVPGPMMAGMIMQRRRRSRTLVAVGVAVVCAVIFVPWAFGNPLCGNGHRGGRQLVATRPSGGGLTRSHQSALPPSRSASVPHRYPECVLANVRIQIPTTEAGETRGGTSALIVFINKLRATCVLRGYPHLSAYSAAGQKLRVQWRPTELTAAWGPYPVREVVLLTGRKAYSTLFIATQNRTCTDPFSWHVALPTDTRTVVIGENSTVFNMCTSEFIMVSPIHASR